jgi:hypothetical protein
MKNIKIILLLFFLVWSSATLAATNTAEYIKNIQQIADQKSLYTKNEWIALGHYRDRHINMLPSSEADDTHFFLAPNGKENPQAELAASLAAFFEPASLGDQHAQCVFPARFYWLKNKLSIDASMLPHPDCTAFNAWQHELNASSVVLVFPSAYLNSPSSMFGHTFLRLDSTNSENQSDLLSYAINYAANMDANDGEIMFAYKGIFGGYPGTTFVQPYYEKVKEYHDWENRDIWEYKLNLQQDEVNQLVRHAWEIRPINFDYYFFTENCSYRVLDLIEVARPSLNLVDQFRIRSIPSDTVRAVVNDNLVTRVNYRPSAATELSFKLQQLSPSEKMLAKALSENTLSPESASITALSKDRQAAVIETAYSYLHYKQLHEKWTREMVASTALKLLAARSAIKNIKPLPSPPAPTVRPDQGHDTKKVSLTAGVMDDKYFDGVGFQMAYHGLLDPSAGYQRGAQIEFFSGNVRFYEAGEVQIENVKFINITSLSPRDDFFNPWSWNVGAGLRRELVEDDRPLLAYGEAAVGGSYMVDDQLLFLLLHNEIEADNSLQKDHRIGSGPLAGWQWQYQQHQGLLQYKAIDYWAGEHDIDHEIEYKQTFTMGKNVSLSASVKRTTNQEQSVNQIEGGFNVYF